MKNLLLAALASLSLAAAPATLHSHLLIDAGKQFLLGGGQPGAFTVQGRNVGPVPVAVREEPRTGPAIGRGTLAPGATARLKFAAGSTARLINLGTKQAVLELDVTGDTGQLRMTYEPAQR
ncbi:hypothetical protein Q5H93_20365 [Hymenobacter sp. ASUV-10]|uniref:DUF4198 domain-containing protein n=1 Tax=Hymenobacter aranciens TaxID=3063996 RepID=A0ABT9BFS7_9BACT|nr:hypothetical protein [Hymenobacter sp. ASUV-10]MDO7877111.1 hypothetical protein [Hymenobacter sp. ASUV-10]